MYKIEFTKVTGYKAVCPQCDWSTTNETAELTVWTMKYHIKEACPETGRRLSPA